MRNVKKAEYSVKHINASSHQENTFVLLDCIAIWEDVQSGPGVFPSPENSPGRMTSGLWKMSELIGSWGWKDHENGGILRKHILVHCRKFGIFSRSDPQATGT